MLSQANNKKITGAIKKRYPQLKCVQLNGGVNIHLGGREILTIWFKKEIWASNHKTNIWNNYDGLDNLFQIIDDKLPIPVQIPEGFVLADGRADTHNRGYEVGFPASSNMQKAIDHLTKKRERVIELHPNDNRLATILQTFIDELHQFA